MGDRTWTSIRFSGKLDRDKVPVLLKAIRDDGLRTDEGPEGAITAEHLEDRFYDEEADYGLLENAESAAQELGLNYIKDWEAGAGYGPGKMVYVAVFGQSFECATVESEPVATLSELRKKSSEELVRYFRVFDEDNYPPLEIVGELETTEGEE